MPERERNVDAKIARVDQHLGDFEKETVRRLDIVEKAVASTNARLITLALTIAGSAVGLALTTLISTGKL